MSKVSSFPSRVDMLDWRYPALAPGSLKQVASNAFDISFESTTSPYSGASVRADFHPRYLRIEGVDLGDFDAMGIPRSGFVTQATIFSAGHFNVAISEIHMPAAEFFRIIGSNDPVLLRQALLSGDDFVQGGQQEAWNEYGLVGDILLGEAGNDTIWSFGGRDTIMGGPGNDQIWLTDRLGAPADSIDGGAGLDVVSFDLDYSGGAILDLSGAGADTVTGVEMVLGSISNDWFKGSAGDDSFYGSEGDDTLIGGDGFNFIRGGAGGDSLQGGSGWDDLLGNMGADTLRGAGGGDWVVGGQDGDQLHGEDGADIVHGNMGADTAFGGDGDDVILGGQDSDSLSGGAGADYLSGDRGADTLSGGGGGDLFYLFPGAGADLVQDFSAAEGDRVLLAPGTTYTLSQSGGDLIVDLGGGDRLVLQGVNAAALPPGWI